MDLLNSLSSPKNIGQLILSFLFLLFLISPMKIPHTWAKYIDSQIGVIVIIFILIWLVCTTHPIVSILAVLVAYELMKRSKTEIKNSLVDYYPVQEKKWTPFSAHHQFPYTLEQEIVNKNSNKKFNLTPTRAPYKPVVDNTHEAMYIK